MSSTAETSSSASTSPTVVAGSHVKTGAVWAVWLVSFAPPLYGRVRLWGTGRPVGRPVLADNTFEAVAVPPRSHQRSGSRSYPQADSMGMIAAPTDSSAGHGKYSLSSSEETTTSEAQRPRAGRRRSEYIETVPPLEYAPQANSPDRRARKQSNGSSTRAVALAKLNTAAANNSTATTATTASGHSRQRSADRSAYAADESFGPYSASHEPEYSTSVGCAPEPDEEARALVPLQCLSGIYGEATVHAQHSGQSLTPAQSRED
ncbi:uncharacterized protein B0H18DRAFT_1123664 [Fomitopsis serialis]|uniref:uncharacterized protein n=1 Tax=Fomitopsis serialis TaxID=139415 RepID=UPI00200886F6|nr:uncharacterized protein B0H18DRAFT_1123664 [Neoantrodia serialis]KAH9917317.1 hypothetical protein B0H18DRAFT_1123664 [Neoantrodia serialis]